MLKVKCPTCDSEVVWNSSSTFKPFCSERCKLIDLGEWAAENHRIPDKNLQEIQTLSEEQLAELDEALLQQDNQFFR